MGVGVGVGVGGQECCTEGGNSERCQKWDDEGH